jgi:hypothetical protein
LGRKKQEFRSNAVLATAIYSGLSSLVWLAKKHQNKQTKAIYQQISDIWDIVLAKRGKNRSSGSHDFSFVQKLESPLRKLNFRMLWESTKRYGNRERTRVYSWKEGTIGDLNNLLNFAGATLRDVVVPRYPFPPPQLYEIRELPNRTEQVIPKEVAEKIPAAKGVRTHLRAGYRGNSKQPRVLLTHPTLPAMDFGDMIRAHLIELCRQCFIHCVPRTEVHRYTRLLIHRLIPFLDWIYTQGQIGRKNFSPEANKELRKIVLEIRSNYSRLIASRNRISKQVEDFPQSFDIKVLKEQVELLDASIGDPLIKKKCKAIIRLIDREVVTYREIEKFLEQVMKKVQQEGTNWHDVLLSGFPQPHSLKEVIFSGDHFLRTPAGIQYLAEVPVSGQEGSGKIDLILFVRIKWRDYYIWAPIMILEVKTKAGFDFNLYGKRPRTKKPKVFVPVLNSRKVPLQKLEWEKTLSSVPPKGHTDQLDIYEKTLLCEYHSLIGDTIGFKNIWKGVVTLDVSQEYGTVKEAFDSLIDDLADKLVKGEFKGEWKTLTLKDQSPDESAPRVAITMTPSQGPANILKSISPLTSILFEDPFQERMEDDTFFTQYISLTSPTSSGKTAAWLSKNWHLLNHLSELKQASFPDTSLVWIDLIGDFPTEYLREKRFRLEELKKQKLIMNTDYEILKVLLERIAFVSIREDIDTFLFDGDSSGLENVRVIIESTLKPPAGNRVIVVDGWSDLEDMTPATRRINLQTLELSLLQILKGQVSEVIWTDTGVDLPQVSERYQRNCSSPLYYSSPRKQLIDEILWNVPTAPQKIGWHAPQYEDTRVIIQDLPTEQNPWTTAIRVPYLRGLSHKFSKASVRSPVIKNERYSGSLNQQENMYGRNFRSSTIQVRSDAIDTDSLDEVKQHAMKLIPSLLRLRQGGPLNSVDKRNTDWTTISQYVDMSSTQPSLSSRLHLDMCREPPHPNRIGADHEGIYVDAEGITRGWIHKESSGEDEGELVPTFRRPPSSYIRRKRAIDTLETRRREVHRIATAARYLAREVPHYDSLFREIGSICNYDRDEVVDEEHFFKILQQIRATILRKNEPKQLWNLLLTTRLHNTDLLNTDNQRILRQALKDNPELLELYGMNLFLAIASVVDRVLKRVDSLICKTLWAVVARWQFYQMGFEQDDNDEFEKRYDFQTIHANLVWRAQQMKKSTPTTRPTFPVQFGQLLTRDMGDNGQSWLLFPSFKRTMFGAFIEQQLGAYLQPSWNRGVIDPEQIKDVAEEALKRDGWDEYPIALVDVKTQRVLFVKTEGDEGEEWTFAGAFEYGNPPKGQSQPVRWIRISQPLPETLIALHGFILEDSPDDTRILCDRVLREASEWSGVIRDVTCTLTIDTKKSLYRIELREGNTTIAQKETASTDDVINFLRYPLKKGKYFSTKGGTYLRWDPLRDVDYDSVVTRDADGKTGYISLTIFKPLIHRSVFFPESYSLPLTCKELLQTQQGEDITLRILVDEKVRSIGSKKYLKVQFDELTTSRLTRFEYEEMGIFDVALLCECEQLIDVDAEKRHNVSINVEALVTLGVVHLLAEYPNLESAILSQVEDLQQAEIEDYEEGHEEEQEYIEPDYEEGLEQEYEEGMEQESEYIVPDFGEGPEEDPHYDN